MSIDENVWNNIPSGFRFDVMEEIEKEDITMLEVMDVSEIDEKEEMPTYEMFEEELFSDFKIVSSTVVEMK